MANYFIIKKQLITNKPVATFNNKPLQKANHLIQQSDSVEFGWGFNETGQESLALAMLLEITSKEVALEFYHIFAEEFIYKQKEKKWSISEIEVKNWLQKSQAKQTNKNLVNKVCNKLDITRLHLSEMMDVTEHTVEVWSRRDSNIPNIAKLALELLLKTQSYEEKFQRIKDVIQRPSETSL